VGRNSPFPIILTSAYATTSKYGISRDTHSVEVVYDPDFSVILCNVILHKVAFHADVHVFLDFIAVLQGKIIRLLHKQFVSSSHKYFSVSNESHILVLE